MATVEMKQNVHEVECIKMDCRGFQSSVTAQGRCYGAEHSPWKNMRL